MFRFITGSAVLFVCCSALAQPSVAAPDSAPRQSAAPIGGSAPPLHACAAKAFDGYAASMSAWERQWADAVNGTRPELSLAAVARANAHNSALQRDAFRIHYLASNLPDSLNLDETIASLRLFDWTPQEEQALRTSEAEYAGVSDSAERARLAADSQPKSEELEVYFEESFTQNDGANMAHKLSGILEQGNAALATCHKNFVATPKADPAAAPADAKPATTALATPAKS